MSPKISIHRFRKALHRLLQNGWVAFLFFLALPNQASYGQAWELATTAGGPGLESLLALTARKEGGTLLAGLFSDSLTWDGKPLRSAGGTDGYLAGLDEADRLQSIQLFHSPEDVEIVALSEDSASGRTALAGAYRAALWLGTDTVESPGGNRSLFLAVQGGSAENSWLRSLDGTGLKGIGALHWTGGDTLWVAGYFGGELTAGDTVLRSQGTTDVFLLTYSGDGTLLQARTWGGTGNARARVLQPLPGGDLLVGGVFDNTLQLGETVLEVAIPGSDPPDPDLFLFRLQRNGSIGWSQRIGGVFPEEITAMVRSENGSIELGGFFSGVLSYGADLSLQSTNNEPDAFRIEISEDGTLKQGMAFGGPGNVRLFDLATRGNELLGTGAFTGSMELGQLSIEAGDRLAGFVFRMRSAEGQVLSLDAIRSDNTVFLQTAAYTSSGERIGGDFSGQLENGSPSQEGSLDILLLRPDETTNTFERPNEFFLLSLYPNPTRGPLFLKTVIPCDSFQLMTAAGELIKAGPIPETAYWDLSNLPAGPYLMRLRTEGKWRSLRFQKY